MTARLEDDDDERRNPLHELEAMFAGASSPSAAYAGPSRSDIGGSPRHREFSEARRPHIHKRRIKHRGDDDDHVRHDIVKLLQDIEDRLAAEISRAEAAELRSREADARAAALKVGQRTLEAKTKAAQDAVLVCRTELRNARVQIDAGQAEIQRLEVERNDAEAAAVRARDTARKAAELLSAENAREEGRREGIAIGRNEGMRFAQAQGWSSVNEQDDRPADRPQTSTAPRVNVPPTEIDFSSPTPSRRPRRHASSNTDSMRRKDRSRPPVQPIFESLLASGPAVAPPTDTIPRQATANPAIEASASTPLSPRAQPSGRSTKHSRARSSSIAGRNISGPIPIPSRPITPTPGPSVEHPPVAALPDTYIPTLDQESVVPFPLPPPHELSGIPTTPSISSRVPLTPANAPIAGPGSVFTGAGPAVATQAARAVTRGIRSLFNRNAKRTSTSTTISGLTLLREPEQALPGPVEDPRDHRPALSVIVEDTNGNGARVTRRASHSTVPPPRPIFTSSEQQFSPISPQLPGSRDPSMSPVDSGLPQWNAEQARRRMMAEELRNSDPDVGAEMDMRSVRSGSRPPESIRSAGYASYHHFNRTKPQMPRPLAPSTDRSDDQAERYGGASRSRTTSESHHPDRTPAHSISSIGASSTYRKAPPSMPTPMIAVQPPTRSNSYQPPGSNIIYSPRSQGRAPQPHPVSPTGPPSVSIVSPTPTHARRASGPSITVTRPHSTAALPAPQQEDNGHRPLRRQSSTSSIGSAASSVHSRRSAYKTFDKSGYVDPAFMATADTNHNPFPPGTTGAAMYSRSRPPSPMGSVQNF